MITNQLVLNFLPLNCDGRLKAFTSSYSTIENFNRLKEENANSILYRTGNKVYSIPIIPGTGQIGEETFVDINNNPKLVCRLISEGVFHSLKQNNRIFTKSVMPTTFIELDEDKIRKIHRYADKLNGLHIYPEISINIRWIKHHRFDPIFGLIVDISSKYDIEYSIHDLLNKGVNVTGLYIVTKPLTSTKYNRSTLLGRIQSVKGNKVVLSDYKDNAEANIDNSYPESSPGNFKFVVKSLLGSEYKYAEKEIEKELFKITGAVGKYDLLNNIINELRSLQDISLIPDIKITPCNSLLHGESSDLVELTRVRKPTFIFDPAKQKVDTWHNRGLNKYGPFDSEAFRIKEPEIVVIVPDIYKGEVERFLRVFILVLQIKVIIHRDLLENITSAELKTFAFLQLIMNPRT